MDPWLYAFTEEYKSGQLKIRCPIQILNTEYFHNCIPKEDFDSWGSVKAVMDYAEKEKENIILNKVGHASQIDLNVTDPWTSCMV